MLYDEKWNRVLAPTEVPLERWQKLLLDAADVIERRGWTRGRSTSARLKPNSTCRALGRRVRAAPFHCQPRFDDSSSLIESPLRYL
jgi:hypothetical protein